MCVPPAFMLGSDYLRTFGRVGLPGMSPDVIAAGLPTRIPKIVKAQKGSGQNKSLEVSRHGWPQSCP